MNFLELQQRISEYVGSYAGFTTQNIKDRINDARLEIAQDISFNYLKDTYVFTTTAGVNSYNLPSDFHYERLVVLDKNAMLVNVSDEYLFEQAAKGSKVIYDISSVQDQPKYYIITSSLKLYPNPDKIYTIDLIYYKRPFTLTNDGDSDDMTKDYPYAIIYKALYLLYDSVGSDTDAQKYEGKFLREMYRVVHSETYKSREKNILRYRPDLPLNNDIWRNVI